MLNIAARYAEQQGFSLSPKILRNFTNAPGPSLILPRLYLGDYADAGNLNLLRDLSVTHVVSVVETMPWPLHKTRLEKMHVSLRDDAFTNIIDHFDRTSRFITEALEAPESVVMVHCFKGKSRSAAVVAAYLLTQSDTRDVVETLDLLREKRSIVEPNPGFIHQLQLYNSRLFARRVQGTDVLGVNEERGNKGKENRRGNPKAKTATDATQWTRQNELIPSKKVPADGKEDDRF